MNMTAITEFDVIFLSYDEPNAEMHWANLLDICPWAKRVHGVKGFDNAHRACAEKSETDWFITVDADNIVRPEFFNLTLDNLPKNARCISWNGQNVINGLTYGNGGLKLWSKEFALTMNTHENADDPRKAVDFCWEAGYFHLPGVYSDVYVNGSPFQAFRVGFREGVKLSLDRGKRVDPEVMGSQLHPQNLRNLRIWCSVGSDIEYGQWAIAGARMGWALMCDKEWDHTVVRDYDWFNAFWKTDIVPALDGVKPENLGRAGSDIVSTPLTEMIDRYGRKITEATKIINPFLDPPTSQFFRSCMTP